MKVNIPPLTNIKLPKLKPIVAPIETVKEGMEPIEARQIDLPKEKTEEETKVVETKNEKTDNGSTEPAK